MIRLIKLLFARMDWTNFIQNIALLIFFIQFVRWFSNYWLDDTTRLVYVVLGIVFAVELLLFRLSIWIRLPLQFVGLIVSLLVVLDLELQPIQIESEVLLSDTLLHYANQLHPYVWFALAAWLLFMVLTRFLKTRERVFLTMVLSVIAMAIADSYTHIYLLDETAYVVVSGLILMVNRHFENLRQKHPLTWKYVTEYPWSIALTAGALISIIALVSLIAPNVRPLLVDPYTAWHQLQGRAVNFSVKDDTRTAIASFANYNNGGNNGESSPSGYGRDDSLLGGAFLYDYDPVFEVRTTVRSYWRGESKAIYTGLGWRTASELPDVEIHHIGDVMKVNGNINANVPVKRFTQSVTVVDEEASSSDIIFGAYPIVQVQSVNRMTENRSDYIVHNKSNGSVKYRSDVTKLKFYTVVSAVPVASEEQLKSAPLPVIDGKLREYVQLPNTLPKRVYDLVEEITADYDTPYEKVKAIENYLRTNYTYTNTPNESRGRSPDFVDRFLFEIREGYCDFFSTAMAVMVRTLGIPSRWVKGYTPGTLDEQSLRLMEQYYEMEGNVGTDLELTYIVRNADAHSWVEVYFEGYGWIMFEPTAGFTAPTFTFGSDRADSNVDEIAPDNVTPADSATDASGWTFADVIIWAVVVIAALTACVLFWLFGRSYSAVLLRRLKKLLTRIGLIRAPVTPNEQIIHDFNRLLRYVHRKGLVREEHQTVREVVRAWEATYRSTADTWEEVLRGFELAKYSTYRFTEKEVQQYRAKLRELRQYFKQIA